MKSTEDVYVRLLELGDANSTTSLEPVASFEDLLSEDVTVIRFHPGVKNNLLFTASVDGLIAVLDLSGSYDEDESLLRTLNVESAMTPR